VLPLDLEAAGGGRQASSGSGVGAAQARRGRAQRVASPARARPPLRSCRQHTTVSSAAGSAAALSAASSGQQRQRRQWSGGRGGLVGVCFGCFRRIDLVRLWSSARWLVMTRRLSVVWCRGVVRRVVVVVVDVA